MEEHKQLFCFSECEYKTAPMKEIVDYGHAKDMYIESVCDDAILKFNGQDVQNPRRDKCLVTFKPL